jgi:hypothetical protein
MRYFLFLAAIFALPLAVQAQDVQGPPDGFRPPQDNRSPAPGPAEGPADNGIVPLPVAPRPAPPPQEAAPAAADPVRPGPAAARGGALPSPSSPAPTSPRAASPDRPADRAPVDAVVPVVAPAEAVPMVPLGPPTDAPASLPPPPAAAAWPASWWLLLLLPFAAGVWFLLRRSKAAAAAGPAPRALPPEPKRESPVAPPAPSRPAPPRSEPQAVDDANTAAPPMPPPAVAPPARVAGRAQLSLTLQVQALELTDAHLRIQFALMLANSGDRAATGGLVRIALQQANARQGELLERFFDGAGGSVLADEVDIAAGDVGTIERNALLPLDGAEVMLIGGYPSLVPVIGFDVTYHWDGDAAQASVADDSFGQVAAAFVVGSAAAADGRLAPVRLDLGPRTVRAPAARVTAMQRRR